MGIYKKSALLSLLRLRLEKDRGADWQALQTRDRDWYVLQTAKTRWALVSRWLKQFAAAPPPAAGLLSLTLSIVGFGFGFVLIAGLLEFRSLERINLLWFVLLAVVMPVLLWLAAVLVSAGRGSFPLLALLRHRAPEWMDNPSLFPLLRQTAVVLSQQVSLCFASGMLVAFLLYLLVTDLAFGWSSTLEISAASLHALAAVIAWPWQTLWPGAVPDLTLVEQTRFYRAAPATASTPADLGQWWRFLWMCLVTYVWAPRFLFFSWQHWKLRRMQRRCFEGDALIAGWWQRLQSGALSQRSERVRQLSGVQETKDSLERLPVCPHVILWGVWPEQQWNLVKETLNSKIPAFQLYKVKDKQWLAETTAGVMANPAESALVVCKGWEPPTGELADFCRSIDAGSSARYLWPVPLSDMSEERVSALTRSWRAFVPGLPESFNLYTGRPDD